MGEGLCDGLGIRVVVLWNMLWCSVWSEVGFFEMRIGG